MTRGLRDRAAGLVQQSPMATAGRDAHRALGLAGVVVLVVLALLSFTPTAASADERDRRVLVQVLREAITPVAADDVKAGLAEAETGGYQAYVLALDTPGGLDSSMREIVQAVLDAEVPVIVYVSPAGARAASAGAIITFSAHVAAMAPGTTIGAATPVTGEGGDVSRKVVNDAAAYAQSLAQLRGRNAEFARSAVVDGASLPAEEAVRRQVVDLLAPSLTEVLYRADGRVVSVAPGDRQVRLATAGAAVESYEPGVLRTVLGWLANPALTYLLLTVGTLGLIYELASPGIGAGGAVGAICLLLALFSLALLPVNVTGLLLLGLALALFSAEVLAPGIGVFAVAGAAALVLSGVFLFPDAPGLSTGLSLLIPAAVVVGLASVVAGRFALRTRRTPSTTTGAGQWIGQQVTVERVHGEHGQARLGGAWWQIRSVGGPLIEGGRAPVTGLDGLTLLVDPGPANGSTRHQTTADDGDGNTPRA